MAGNEPCSIHAKSIITLGRRRASSTSDTCRAKGRSSRVQSQLFVRTSGGEVRQLLTTEVGTSLELLGADGVDGVDTVTLGLYGSKRRKNKSELFAQLQTARTRCNIPRSLLLSPGLTRLSLRHCEASKKRNEVSEQKCEITVNASFTHRERRYHHR